MKPPHEMEILTVDKLIDKSKPKNASMWERLTEYGRGHVNAAIDDAAKHYDCDRKDLVWHIDSGGAIHIKKKSQLLVEQKTKWGLEQIKFYRDKRLPEKPTKASRGKPADIASQEWSKPMSKSKMMAALKIDSYKTFNAWAKDKAMKQAGNRQTFTIRLDVLDAKTRQKLERA